MPQCRLSSLFEIRIGQTKGKNKLTLSLPKPRLSSFLSTNIRINLKCARTHLFLEHYFLSRIDWYPLSPSFFPFIFPLSPECLFKKDKKAKRARDKLPMLVFFFLFFCIFVG